MIALHPHRLLRLSRSSAIAGWAVSSGSAAPATRAAVLASGAARGAGDGTKAGATKRAARASRTRGSALEPRAIFASARSLWNFDELFGATLPNPMLSRDLSYDTGTGHHAGLSAQH